MTREQFKDAAVAALCVAYGAALVVLFFVLLFTPDTV